jgi:hypothetical protein
MNAEQLLINKWRLLPPDKQQEVIDFVVFLEQNYIRKNEQVNKQTIESENSTSKSNSLEGKLIYYEEPYEPVAVEDWEALG